MTDHVPRAKFSFDAMQSIAQISPELQDKLMPEAPLGLWRHKKSGGIYRWIGSASVQSDIPLSDMDRVEIYQSESSDLWARNAEEFKERFEPCGEQDVLGIADVWHAGSHAFYRAQLLKKLTPSEVFAEPPEFGTNALYDIQVEREAQDKQWGGPDHDDAHDTWDWHKFIGYQLDRLGIKERYPKTVGGTRRERLVKIAALALAAIESMDRKGEQ